MVPALRRILDRLPALAPAQRPVARFFTEHADRLGFFTAAEIARTLGTSDATVVRTAQALGYDGLADLKRALRDGGGPPPTPDRRLAATLRHGTDPLAVLDHTLDVHRAALDLAREQLAGAFPTAVALLAAADRIVLAGTGPSAAVAEYGAVLLGRVGRAALTITAGGAAVADQALALRLGDVLVQLAYSRRPAHVAVVREHGRRLRIPVVLLTDLPAADEDADVVLHCPRGLPGESSSHAVTVLLVDALTRALAAADRPRADAALRDLTRLRSALTGDPDPAGPFLAVQHESRPGTVE